MVKKVLTLALGLVLSFGAMAQYGNPVVPQSDIQFWTGTGSNRAVIAVTWNDATAGNIGVAWGVQWNGSNVTIGSLMDTIAAYDSRLTISGSSSSFISNLSYTDAEAGLSLVGPANWWWYRWVAANGTDKTNTSTGVSGDIAVSGDFVDWLPMDEETYESFPADTMIIATDPNAAQQPVEATIAASEILYWVGEGTSTAILAVNWADTALAWGYRYDGTKTVADMMDDITAADPRFSYTIEGGYLSDIFFVENEGDTLRKPLYSWWESKNNGFPDAGMGQILNDGDVEKWAVPEAGVIVDSMEYEGYWYYTYVYTMEIHPVSVPQTQGISQLPAAIQWQVYPNPVADILTVSFSNDQQSAASVQLYDMRGSLVASSQMLTVDGQFTLDLRSLSAGVYMLRIGDSAVKIVKE